MYHTARRYIGRPVRIRQYHGGYYDGYIDQVNPYGVYFRRRGYYNSYFMPFIGIASIILLGSLFFF